MRSMFLTGAMMATALALGACQTAEDRAASEARLQAEIDARRGEEVNRICFQRNINGWRELSDEAILLQRGVNDWYMVELRGVCDPTMAFNSIALVSRPAGSSCLSRGDKVIIPDDVIGGQCFIDRIYKWDEDAEIPEPPAEEAE